MLEIKVKALVICLLQCLYLNNYFVFVGRPGYFEELSADKVLNNVIIPVYKKSDSAELISRNVAAAFLVFSFFCSDAKVTEMARYSVHIPVLYAKKSKGKGLMWCSKQGCAEVLRSRVASDDSPPLNEIHYLSENSSTHFFANAAPTFLEQVSVYLLKLCYESK